MHTDQQSSADLGLVLVGLGESLIGLDRPRDALPLLCEALRLWAQGSAEVMVEARTRFALARALDAGRSSSWALRHARKAHAGYEAAGERARRERRAVESWMRARDR
ncbi:hypothetical protein [Haliangium sp.]|uniref:hypothetical protein n=1 Tax=Haliangium sp. TaxID=2663208 RepID=UPI003D0DDC4A